MFTPWAGGSYQAASKRIRDLLDGTAAINSHLEAEQQAESIATQLRNKTRWNPVSTIFNRTTLGDEQETEKSQAVKEFEERMQKINRMKFEFWEKRSRRFVVDQQGAAEEE